MTAVDFFIDSDGHNFVYLLPNRVGRLGSPKGVLGREEFREASLLSEGNYVSR